MSGTHNNSTACSVILEKIKWSIWTTKPMLGRRWTTARSSDTFTSSGHRAPESRRIASEIWADRQTGWKNVLKQTHGFKQEKKCIIYKICEERLRNWLMETCQEKLWFKVDVPDHSSAYNWIFEAFVKARGSNRSPGSTAIKNMQNNRIVHSACTLPKVLRWV